MLELLEEQAENTYAESVLLISAEEVVPLVVEMSMDSISSLGLRMWQKISVCKSTVSTNSEIASDVDGCGVRSGLSLVLYILQQGFEIPNVKVPSLWIQFVC